MRQSGFTMAESLVVMTLVGVLSALGFPLIRNALDRSAVRSGRLAVAGLTAAARAAATQRGCRAVLHVTAGPNGHVWITACALRRPGQDTLGGLDPLAARFGVVLAPSRDSIQYDPRGLTMERAAATIGVSRGTVQDSVMINELGKVVR
ncbi:MAG: type II secretion system protein [Gemmatimonadales bacterium]